MARRIIDDEEERRPWLLRFLLGAAAGLVLSAVVLAVVSLYLLPPPAPETASPPQAGHEQAGGEQAGGEGAAEAGAGEPPGVIAGIEVAKTPAYVAPPEEAGASGAPGAPAGAEPGAGDGTAGAEASAADAADALGPLTLEGPALVVNAVPFTPPEGAALLAVIVDDAAAAPLLQDALFELGMPLAIGVVAGREGDRATAARARAAGLEVVAELPLVAPGRAQGAELEYGLAPEEAAGRAELLLRRLPMAVAVSHPLAAPAPPSAGVLAGVLATIAPLGFGYVEIDLSGASAARAAAEALGQLVPVITARHLAPAGTDAGGVYQVLEAAAREAEARGAAVAVLGADPEIIPALELWQSLAEGGPVRLAPLSAAIRRSAR